MPMHKDEALRSRSDARTLNGEAEHRNRLPAIADAGINEQDVEKLPSERWLGVVIV